MIELNVGDVVNLKSNGDTPMTIEEITSESVKCTWLNSNKMQERGEFKITSLEKTKSLQERVCQ